MVEWGIAFIIGSIIPTIIMYFVQLRLKKMTQTLEEKRIDEKNFHIIMIESVLALGENNKAVFEALKSGRTNGNLDKAIANYTRIEDKLNNYLIEKASRS